MFILPVAKLPLKNKPQKTCFSPCLYLSCSVFNNLCLASWVFITLERIGHEKTNTTAKKKPKYKSWEKLYSEEWNGIKDSLSCSAERNNCMSRRGWQKSTIPNVLKIINLFSTWSWKRILMVDRFMKSVKTAWMFLAVHLNLDFSRRWKLSYLHWTRREKIRRNR